MPCQGQTGTQQQKKDLSPVAVVVINFPSYCFLFQQRTYHLEQQFQLYLRAGSRQPKPALDLQVRRPEVAERNLWLPGHWGCSKRLAQGLHNWDETTPPEGEQGSNPVHAPHSKIPTCSKLEEPAVLWEHSSESERKENI